MDVENIDMGLLKSECYICLEPCSAKSPCDCASCVHPKCLIQFLETSGNTHCTICNGQYPVPPPEPSVKPVRILLVAFFCCVLFFPLGWLGSCMSGDCSQYDPFSICSCFSAASGYFLMSVVWVCFNRRLHI